MRVARDKLWVSPNIVCSANPRLRAVPPVTVLPPDVPDVVVIAGLLDAFSIAFFIRASPLIPSDIEFAVQ